MALAIVVLIVSAIGQDVRTPVTDRLRLVGEVRQRVGLPPTAPSFLWKDANVVTSSSRGTWNWFGSPLIQLIDAATGTTLQNRKIKGPCWSDYSFDVWKAIPNSTDLLAEVCGHVLLMDGITVEKKRDLTAKVAGSEKLWASHAIVSPDGKRVALDVSYETRKGLRMVVHVIRTGDWQEEGKWEYGRIEQGQLDKTFHPVLITLDGQRLIGWWNYGLRVLRLPSGKVDSDIDLGICARVTACAEDMNDFIPHVIRNNPDELVVVEKRSGAVWSIHLKDGVGERRAQLADWPRLRSYYRIQDGISSDGNWLCAVTSDPVRENDPAFSIWNIVTGVTWAVGDRWSFSSEERESASRYLARQGEPLYGYCQAASEGNYVMLEVYFGWVSRARIYQVLFQE